MEVFQDLILKIDNIEIIDSLFNKIRNKSTEFGWIIKDDFIENYRKNLGDINKKVICIQSPKLNVLNVEVEGYLWFGQWNDNIEVFNIVPVNSASLSYTEYNKILKEFYELFIKPEVLELNLKLDYSKSQMSIEELAGIEVAKALIHFSENANKSMGRSNPLDSERWMFFVCLAHRNSTKLDVEELIRWLKEEGGWPVDKAWDLGLDYEYSFHLLKYYDTNFNSND